MSNNLYSNVPINRSRDATVQTIDAYGTKPLELDASTYDAMTGFFASKGFDTLAAESTAVIIMKQAKHDGINPMQIMDTLKGLGSVEISALVAEILNYNRFKTSFLGYALEFSANQEVVRNILP